MDRRQATRIYKAGKEAVIEKLISYAEHIRELEQSIAALTRNSSNSSRPPSSDPPGMKKTNTKKKSNRKQGGQPGHKGKNRKLLPSEDMDEINNIFPEHCKHCRSPFSQSLLIPSSQPVRHQVFDLPVIIPIKKEYRCHSLLCQCGHSTSAELPKHVAQSNFGPRTHAAVAYLASVHRVTRRGIADIMQSLFGISISTGAICNAARRVSDACLPLVGAIKQYVASALTLNIDETGWKYKGQRHFLWTFVAPKAVLFHVSPSRAAKVLRKVLGQTFNGVITSDDHSAYASYHKKGLRQLCWAHIIRKLEALKEDRSSPHAYCFARHVLEDIGAIFSCWHKFQESPGSRKQLWLDTLPFRERMNDFCVIFSDSTDKRVKTRTKRLLDNWQHLFTFLRHDGIEPTNNIAERAIRPAVQWRKICFGSQSQIGERFTERLLTVTRTCQMHDINVFTFLTRIVRDSFSSNQHLPARPPLLPF
ncbi:MAG: IS66 family transposase [Desulfobulbaceae bacterium]|nr:IS66 family transposase [Desulfobulbaceae bacterium]